MTYSEEVYSNLEPMQYAEAQTNHALWRFIQAFGVPWEEMYLILTPDEDGREAWGRVLDVTVCPADWLDWLAQFAGVKRIGGLTEQQYRDYIDATSGLYRGTIGSVMKIATAVGMPTTHIEERYSGSAWQVRILTKPSEYTADGWNRIVKAIPAGIVVNRADWQGYLYQDRKTAYATYQALKTANATYRILRGG